jgi:hypothetical protein
LVSSSREFIFATATTYCAGISVSDTRTNCHTNMETIVRTIPELANNVITLTFSEFSLEA